MANKFWEFLKKKEKFEDKYNNENSEDYINKTPTEEELKDNKNGKRAVILSVIALLLCAVVAFCSVLLFDSMGPASLFSLFLLLIPATVQKKSIKLAKKQLNINGKGIGKLIYCKYINSILMALVILTAIVLFIKLSMS